MEAHLIGDDVNSVSNNIQRRPPARANLVSKEEARMLVAELGYNEAANKLQIKACTLRQWAKRFSWNVTRTHAQQTVTSVTRPSVVLSDTLAEHERETRLSLARYARLAAKDSESATIRDSPLVHKVAQVAGLVHKWDSEKSNHTFTLNVLNINSLEQRMGVGESEADTLEA